MAREFAARGRNLALAARRTERLEELRGELLAAHPQITVAIRKLDVDVPTRCSACSGSSTMNSAAWTG